MEYEVKICGEVAGYVSSIENVVALVSERDCSEWSFERVPAGLQIVQDAMTHPAMHDAFLTAGMGMLAAMVVPAIVALIAIKL